MHANVNNIAALRRELSSGNLADGCASCARRFAFTGDVTSVRACYLLRLHPDMTVSEIAEVLGLSVSAASRCLRRLHRSEVVTFRREARSVRYSMVPGSLADFLGTYLETMVALGAA